MKPWEKHFVETPLRWGKRVDPGQWPPTEWWTGTAGGMPYAAGRFVDGPRAATEIVFMPHSVLWQHWHEAGGYHDPDSEIPWMVNQGMWNKDHFMRLVRAYAHNMRPQPRRFSGPELTSLARDLMKGYLNSIGYEPLSVGPEIDTVPDHIRQLLGRD